MRGSRPHLRIGELSRRVGVSSDRLRAWERRYGVLRPERTAGGFRLYSDDDERRVERMKSLLDEGLAPAEAARMALQSGIPPGASGDSGGVEELASRLASCLGSYEGAQAHAVLDRLLAGFGMEVTLREVIYPYLRELGECWARGEVSVGEEHFSSKLLEGRLHALAHGWDEGSGPRALLACPEGERHELGLIGFGLALRNRGWRICYLGADTPGESLLRAASRLSPELVTMSAVDPSRFHGMAEELKGLPRGVALLVGGAGGTAEVAKRLGGKAAECDPVSAAEEAAAAA